MKEYKRLTERDMFNNADIIGLSTEKLYSELCFSETNLLTKALNKLAELEDKIEQKVLIELPCKVGDKIWYVSYIRIEEDRAINILEEWDVEKIDIYDDFIICRLTHKGTDHYNTARNDEFGERWFLTKTKAEARLKELKGEL